MKSERATVEEPSHSGGKSIQNIIGQQVNSSNNDYDCGLLSTIWMIDMIDRVMIGLALPMIGDEFSSVIRNWAESCRSSPSFTCSGRSPAACWPTDSDPGHC